MQIFCEYSHIYLERKNYSFILKKKNEICQYVIDTNRIDFKYKRALMIEFDYGY